MSLLSFSLNAQAYRSSLGYPTARPLILLTRSLAVIKMLCSTCTQTLGGRKKKERRKASDTSSDVLSKVRQTGDNARGRSCQLQGKIRVMPRWTNTRSCAQLHTSSKHTPQMPGYAVSACKTPSTCRSFQEAGLPWLYYYKTYRENPEIFIYIYLGSFLGFRFA